MTRSINYLLRLAGKQKRPVRLGTQGERTSAVPPEFGQAKGAVRTCFPVTGDSGLPYWGSGRQLRDDFHAAGGRLAPTVSSLVPALRVLLPILLFAF